MTPKRREDSEILSAQYLFRGASKLEIIQILNHRTAKHTKLS